MICKQGVTDRTAQSQGMSQQNKFCPFEGVEMGSARQTRCVGQCLQGRRKEEGGCRSRSSSASAAPAAILRPRRPPQTE